MSGFLSKCVGATALRPRVIIAVVDVAVVVIVVTADADCCVSLSQHSLAAE